VQHLVNLQARRDIGYGCNMPKISAYLGLLTLATITQRERERAFLKTCCRLQVVSLLSVKKVLSVCVKSKPYCSYHLFQQTADTIDSGFAHAICTHPSFSRYCVFGGHNTGRQVRLCGWDLNMGSRVIHVGIKDPVKTVLQMA
jgi:hypothetical protein